MREGEHFPEGTAEYRVCLEAAARLGRWLLAAVSRFVNPKANSGLPRGRADGEPPSRSIAWEPGCGLTVGARRARVRST
jgi:hypothetical protein